MPAFGKMLQIGILTDDLDTAIHHYQQFGFGPWETMLFDTNHVPGGLIDGKEEGELQLKVAMCQHGDVEFELIQPISEGIFMDWVKEHSTGVHHIAFKPKGGYSAFMEEYIPLGLGNVIDVSTPDGKQGFTYLDTSKPLGFFTEIHRGEPGRPDNH